MIVEDSSTFWIGLDDTDEREYGCTTYDFNHLLLTLQDSGFSVISSRLVRLWPFAPQRTRGNAALSASIRCTDSSLLEDALNEWFLSKYGGLESWDSKHSAQPTLLLTNNQLPEDMYWETVRNHVELDERIDALSIIEHRMWHTEAGCMGLIGASAAIAWKGTRDWTWECTAWRQKTGPRDVAAKFVEEMASKFPGTILNRDPTAKRSLIAPRTPCPVLYGIRGEEEEDVLQAHFYLQKLPVEKSISHRAYRTNQATDDHLQSAVKSVVERTVIRQGGHVEIYAEEKMICFSQGGPVNQLAQSLVAGDEIEWCGIADEEGTFHIEKLRLISGRRNQKRPRCGCGTRYKSKGKNQRLKCPKCGSTAENEWEMESIESAWLEPPISSMRHLSKPLGRIGKSED